MVDKKVSGLTEVTSLADNDVLTAVDVSDQTMSTSGTNVKIIKSNLFTGYENNTQLNLRDVNNRSRVNHTGTQLLNTISNAGTLAGLNSVGSAQITSGSITNTHIADGAISESKLTNYEEFSFTPVFTGFAESNVTATYTTQTGIIIRKSSQVLCVFALGWSALSGTGQILISGMPQAKNYTGTLRFPLQVSYYNSLNLPANTNLIGYIQDNLNYISLWFGNNSDTNIITTTELSSSGELYGSVLYTLA